jgi:multisubunit Na+/H+ antiporter MnhB subunit
MVVLRHKPSVDRRLLSFCVGLGAAALAAAAGNASGQSVTVDLILVNGSPAGAGDIGLVDTVDVSDGDVLTFSIDADFSAAPGGDFINGAIFALDSVGAFGLAQNIEPNPVFEDLFSLSKVFDDNAIEIQELQPASTQTDIGLVAQIATFEFVVDAPTGTFSYDALTTQAPTTGGANDVLIRDLGNMIDAIPIAQLEADTIRIDPVPTCVGDINGDGVTDGFDFSDLADNFGAGPDATLEQGDINGDGFVDTFDFADLADDFGCGT